MSQLKITLTTITLFCLLMIPAALWAKKDNEHYRREHPERFCPACGQLLPTR